MELPSTRIVCEEDPNGIWHARIEVKKPALFGSHNWVTIAQTLESSSIDDPLAEAHEWLDRWKKHQEFGNTVIVEG